MNNIQLEEQGFGRVSNNRQRRVIHIEFSHRELPGGLQWAERAGK